MKYNRSTARKNMRSRKLRGGVTFKNKINRLMYNNYENAHNNVWFNEFIPEQLNLKANDRSPKNRYKAKLNAELNEAKTATADWVAEGQMTQNNYDNMIKQMTPPVNWEKNYNKIVKEQEKKSKSILNNVHSQSASRLKAQNYSSEFAKLIQNINMNNINTSASNGGNLQFKNKVTNAINSITNRNKKDKFKILFKKFFTDERRK